VTFTQRGAILGERFLSRWFDSVAIVGAATRRDGWVIAALKSRDLLIVRESTRGPPTILHRLKFKEYRPFLPDTLANPYVQGATNGNIAVISLQWRPYLSFVFESESPRPRIFAPRTDAPGSIDTTRMEVALAALPLGDRFLQTVVDLRSDVRTILLFDSRGREIRRTTIEAPLGYIGVSGDGSVVLAIRRVGASEAVLYRSSWHRRNDR
jgi:hypothetical protein